MLISIVRRLYRQNFGRYGVPMLKSQQEENLLSHRCQQVSTIYTVGHHCTKTELYRQRQHHSDSTKIIIAWGIRSKPASDSREWEFIPMSFVSRPASTAIFALCLVSSSNEEVHMKLMALLASLLRPNVKRSRSLSQILIKSFGGTRVEDAVQRKSAAHSEKGTSRMHNVIRNALGLIVWQRSL